MGAAYCERIYPKCTEDELKQIVEQMIQEDVEENGSMYSGSWGSKKGEGITILDKCFLSESDASQYVDKNADKFGPILAAKIYIDIDDKTAFKWLIGAVCPE